MRISPLRRGSQLHDDMGRIGGVGHPEAEAAIQAYRGIAESDLQADRLLPCRGLGRYLPQQRGTQAAIAMRAEE